MLVGSGQREGLSTSTHAAVGQGDVVAHAGRGGDQVQLVLALQPFLNDLHVQQAEEAAAEAEAQGDGALRLEEERGIVEAQFFQGIAQQRVLVGVDGVSPAKTIGLMSSKPGNCCGGAGLLGYRVADLGVADVLDCGGEEAYFSGSQHANLNRLRHQHAH